MPGFRKMNHLETVFFAALEIQSPEARTAYLGEACGGDADLRERVEQMLAIQSKVGSFMERPAVALNGMVDLDPKILDAGLTAGRCAIQTLWVRRSRTVVCV